MMGKASRDEVATGTAHPLLGRNYRIWLVVVLLLLSTLNFADRAILSILAQPIKEDLKLTDTELGMLQGLGFAILYSLLGLPIGWLAERVNRRNLIAVCVAIWSLMTSACGFAGSFGALLLGRVGVGIGEAGFQPPTSSLVADHFKSDRRGTVMAIILLGAPLGFLVGQSLGGWVASVWGWRVAFFALGVPGVIAAFITWLTLREPPRGLAEGRVVALAAPTFKEAFVTLWSKPTFRHLLVGFVVGGFAMNAVAQFVLPFYLRSFGMSLATAGVLFGAISFSSNGLGMLVGGLGFDRLSRRDARWPLWGPAMMLVLATPSLPRGLRQSHHSRFIGIHLVRQPGDGHASGAQPCHRTERGRAAYARDGNCHRVDRTGPDWRRTRAHLHGHGQRFLRQPRLFGR